MPVYLLGALGVVGAFSFILLFKAFRADGGFGGITPASFLLAAVVLLPNLTTTVGMFLGERVVLIDPFFNRIVRYTGLSQDINAIASPLLLASAVVVVFVQIHRKAAINSTALWFVFLLVIAALSNWNSGGRLLDGGHATLLAVVVAAALLPRDSETIRGAALGVGLLLCISALGAWVRPEFAVLPCDDRKCGVLGTFYVGVADNQNTFGLLMALAIPVFYLGLSRYKLYFAFLATFFALASGARTAAIAATVTLLVVVIVHASRHAGARFGRLLATLFTFGAALAASIIPFMQLPPGTFSDRAGLWILARDMVGDQWLMGHGSELWRSFVNIGVIPLAAGYSTHNQVLETLFVAGTLGAVVMAVVLTLAVCGQKDLGAFALLILPMAIAAVTERPWSLGAVDWASWTLLLFLTAAPRFLGGKQDAFPAQKAGDELAGPTTTGPSHVGEFV